MAEAVRHFRHPDGRVWAIAVRVAWIELTFTDSDGDEHTRTRVREGNEDLTAFGERLVQEQRLEGFVEVGPADAKEA